MVSLASHALLFIRLRTTILVCFRAAFSFSLNNALTCYHFLLHLSHHVRQRNSPTNFRFSYPLTTIPPHPLLDADSCFTHRCCTTLDWELTFAPFFYHAEILAPGFTRVIGTGEMPETTSALWMAYRIMRPETLDDDLTPTQGRARHERKL